MPVAKIRVRESRRAAVVIPPVASLRSDRFVPALWPGFVQTSGRASARGSRPLYPFRTAESRPLLSRIPFACSAERPQGFQAGCNAKRAGVRWYYGRCHSGVRISDRMRKREASGVPGVWLSGVRVSGRVLSSCPPTLQPGVIRQATVIVRRSGLTAELSANPPAECGPGAAVESPCAGSVVQRRPRGGSPNASNTTRWPLALG